jgi:hypothetical protein
MKITTEWEGVYQETPLGEMSEFLCNIAEIAHDLQDFIRKVEYGVTNETSRVSDEDRATLTQWYYEEYPKQFTP